MDPLPSQRMTEFSYINALWFARCISGKESIMTKAERDTQIAAQEQVVAEKKALMDDAAAAVQAAQAALDAALSAFDACQGER